MRDAPSLAVLLLLVLAILAVTGCDVCEAPKRAGCRSTTETVCTPMWVGKSFFPWCHPITTEHCAIDTCASRKDSPR